MVHTTSMPVNRPSRMQKWGRMIIRDFQKHWLLYLMVLPTVIYYIVWCYAPMYGIQIAFKDFKPRKGIAGSP